MAKRSKRRPSRHERDQSGCISGLINVFHFRHGRSTKRLPADRKQLSKQAVAGIGHSNNNTISPSPTEKCENLADTEDGKMPICDAVKTSVKALMQEEMFNEQDSKQLNESETGSTQINLKSGDHKKNHKKKKRSSAKSSDMDSDQAREQKPSDNLDLERILEELANINQINTNFSDADVTSSEAVTLVEEKLVEAVKLFTRHSNNSTCFGKEGNNCYSEELMDAFKTLSLNKGLFLKRLQDPNSELSKHIRNFEDARLGKESEEKTVKLKSEEISSHKNRNFFRRRTKSLENYPLGENFKDCQSRSKIVTLKPGPVRLRSPETYIAGNDKLHNDRNISPFSFTEIRRKIRHAMGKERGGVSPERLSCKDKGENFGWSSPNRNHFYTERFTLPSPNFKKGEPVGKLKDTGSEDLRLGGSNIYIEAKKHLSEMLKSGDEITESTTGNNSVKFLGRILSLPEYNVSPCLSPKNHGDDIFVTEQIRLSPRGTLKDNPSPRVENSESQPCISCSSSEDKVQYLKNVNANSSLGDDQEYSLEISWFNEDNLVSQVADIEQTIELRPRQEKKIIDISCESSSSSIGRDIQHGDTREVDNEESVFSCLKSHLSGDEVPSSTTVSPSHDRASTGVVDSDRANDKIEQPSPVSVLDPLFADDDISPASTVSSHSVEKEIQPRHIQFEEERQPSFNDRGICTRISSEDEESAFEYVEAVLLGSGLNWDEFVLRWISLYEILDLSLFEEVELFSSRPHHDQKLLFDCANEALKEVCRSYFGCFANVKPSIRPVPKGMDLIHEVWGRVERHLLQNLRPHSLDHLVKRDLAGSRNWMDIHSGIELIVFDMEESIFDGLVEEIVLSYEDDTCS